MASWPELLLLAVSPSIFLLWFFYHKDRYEHEPVSFLAKVFVLGALTTILASLIEAFVGVPLFQPDNGLLQSILFFFIVVGPVEEFSKFGAVRVRAYRSPEFDEPMDGIVLGVSAALGFATVENIAYVFTAPPEAQVATAIARAFLSVPAHAFWGAITGFFLGQAKYLKKPKLAYVGLAIAALLHGGFDATSSVVDAVTGDSLALTIFGILVLGGMVYLSYLKIVRPEILKAEDESPFKNQHALNGPKHPNPDAMV